MKWDCIIVGAGSSGCAVAYELVKAGRRVLLIEAGGSDRSVFIKIPAAVWSIRSYHDWGYHSQPDASRHGATEPWHRGRVLGGTSSINGMVYARGAGGDYDRWAQLCRHAGGWSENEVMPIFRDLETCDQTGPTRGQSGPLYVRTVKRPHATTEAFVESACVAGYPYNSDYNGTHQEGVGYLQYTQRRGLRWSAADAFLKPILGRKNFHLRLKTEIEKVEVSAGQARAVVVRHKGKRYREEARDIVLCAGAINTPKLLMLSGLGDPVELTRHKIRVVLDLPGVGRNLREHSLIGLNYRSKVPTYNLTEGMLQKCAIVATYLRYREGPIAAAYEATAFLKSAPSDPIPEFQIFFAPIGWGRVGEEYRLAPYPALNACLIRSHSVSSGRVCLASDNPSAAPVIECSLLDNVADVDALVRGIEMVRQVMGTKPIRDLVEAETSPGSAVSSAKAQREYVRRHATTSCHPMGTCRMGVGTDAVVGPDLRVLGIENLWIADASIMPDAISANLNAPCMMIGAKLGKQLAATRQQ